MSAAACSNVQCCRGLCRRRATRRRLILHARGQGSPGEQICPSGCPVAVPCVQSVPPPRVMDEQEQAAVTSSSANRLMKQRFWWQELEGRLEGAGCTGSAWPSSQLCCKSPWEQTTTGSYSSLSLSRFWKTIEERVASCFCSGPGDCLRFVGWEPPAFTHTCRSETFHPQPLTWNSTR